MGSYPSFDPTLFTKPITEAKFEQLFSEENGAPLFNRAIAGPVSDGLDFKPITALAALKAGDHADPTVNDPGCIKIGAQERCNAGKAAYGTVDLRDALQVSSDVYFYTLGCRRNRPRPRSIQNMARSLGLARKTGIDLPGEYEGHVPDRKWRERVNKREAACRREGHRARHRRSTPRRRGCGISDKRPWSVGDNVNLAVGQGDVQATPLQMAVAYATLANGGKVPRPHLGPAGRGRPGPARAGDPARLRQRVDIDPTRRAGASWPGLHASASGAGRHLGRRLPGLATRQTASRSTARPVPLSAPGGPTTSPGTSRWIKDVASSRPIVVAATIEGGGFGAEAAAPAVA